MAVRGIKNLTVYLCELDRSCCFVIAETSECQGPDCPPDNVGPSGSPDPRPLSLLLVFLASALFALIVLH